MAAVEVIPSFALNVHSGLGSAGRSPAARPVSAASARKVLQAEGGGVAAIASTAASTRKRVFGKSQETAPLRLLTPVPSPIALPSPGRGAPPPVFSPLSRLGGSAMGEGG